MCKSKSRLYRIWRGMIQRCNGSNRRISKYYHDKGITVCDKWKTFDIFKSWADENGYSEKLTIDRIDNSKGYCPSNCRWADYKQQAMNRSNSINVTFQGITDSLYGWSKRFGLNYPYMRRMLKRHNKEEVVRIMYRKYKMVV